MERYKYLGVMLTTDEGMETEGEAKLRLHEGGEMKEVGGNLK